MFTTARLKLTIWYLCIIMLISIMFSFSIYRILTGELERGFHRISQRYQQELGPLPSSITPEMVEPSYLQASEDRIKWTLIYINLIIFGVSGVGGYILAGITLKPIRQMIDEQNRFVADASHELRTPITALRSEIEVFLRGKHHTQKEATELVESNLEEVNNLQALSDNLIQLAQYQKSPTGQVFTNISLAEVVDAAVKKQQKQAKQKEITIANRITDDTILGDKDDIIQLFSILIDNAVKYSPEKSQVTLTSQKTDDIVKVSITDKGMGIDEKDMPHIFDRFYRADSSRTKQGVTGYGLGLSIGKKIATAHHGSIQVTSTINKGSVFIVSLPLTK